MSQQIDANEIIQNLLTQIGTLSQEIAMLRVQLAVALKPDEEEVETE